MLNLRDDRNITPTLAQRTMKLRRFAALIVLGVACHAWAIDMKVDSVTINTPSGAAATWQSVTFQSAFGAVPVVIVTPTNSNSQPATLRIRNVTTTGFEVGVVEPQGADGQTSAMSISYFAAEPGTYTFPGSRRLVVDRYSTSTHQGRFVSGSSWDDVNFPLTFGTTPAVVAQIQTINSQATLDAGVIGNPFMEVAIRNVTTVDVDMALERAETSTGTMVAESIGYMAMENGEEISIAGETIKANVTPDNVRGWDNGCYVRSYSSSFSSTPLVVASQNSRDGGDGGWVRTCSVSSTGVGLQIDEDQANDSERSHTTEEVGVLAISGAFHGTRNGRDLEAGSTTIAASITNTVWTSVSFPNPFNLTPHIFALPTTQGTTPAALRVRNVSTTGFDIAAFQPTGGSGAHPQMDVDYIAIIPGDHSLPSGDVFEVGSIATNRYLAGTGGSTGTETINFNGSYSGGGAMLLAIQSINNEAGLDPSSISSPWMVTATTALSSSQATVAIERAEAISGSISATETLAYFVTQDGASGSLTATDASSIDYEMLVTPRNIQGYDNGCYNNSFSNTYSSPLAVATQSTRFGSNGGWVRRCALSGSSIGLTVDEDQANDSERAHITEEASVFVFSQAFEAEFNAIDHYMILHNGTGVTCEAETVSIAAHDASDIGVEAAGRTITVTATSSTPGWLSSDATWSLATGGGTGTFTDIGSGQATYAFATGESSVSLLLANTSEATIDIDVTDGISTDQDGDALEDPPVSYGPSGLRFYNDDDNDGNADSTDPIANPLTAGTPSNQLILRAVQTNTSTGACESVVTGSQNVELAYECINPSSCVRNDDAEIDGSAIADNAAGSVSDYTTLSLTFDGDGEAPFVLEYFDAGMIQLHARLNIPASGGNPAITLTGNSANTVVRPADLLITQIEDASGDPNPGSTTTGDGFIPANTAFSVTVQARNADGGLTPNFGQESPAETIRLAPVSLVMPSVGDLPNFLAPAAFVATGTAGEFENTSVRWPEVGTLTMQATNSDYLGSGVLNGMPTGSVGRFYPDHIRVISETLDNACSLDGFSYMSDQGFTHRNIDLSISIEAVTSGLNRVQNYQDTYPTAVITYDAENADAGTNLAARLTLPTAPWVGGLYEIIDVDNVGFARALSGANEVPDGPYSSLQIGVRTTAAHPDPQDFLPAALSMNASNSGNCVSAGDCNAVALASTLDLRFGRLVTSSVHGPETAPLNVPFEIQTWDPINGFSRNVNDNCTVFAMGDIYFAGNPLSVDTNRTVNITGGGTSEGTFGLFTAGATLNFVNGDADLNFSAPGANNGGTFGVDIDMSSMLWLRWDWDQDGDATDVVLPTAGISFGRYRGHDRVIYWNEVLN